MKIATYNIWDSDAGMPLRFGQIIDEVYGINADIVCLQEVSDREKCDRLSKYCKYDNSHWQAQTGLLILSRYPIEKTFDFEYGTSACIQSESKILLIINVHLPWEKASLREKAIVDIIEKTDVIKVDYTLLMGDFNCSENSSVHRFLTNEHSLLDADAYYFDLAEAYAEMNETKAQSTLDFRKNPRWSTAETKNTIEVNQRVDWILLKNPFPAELPELKNYVIFGTKVSKETGFAASDHYGVIAEIKFL